jgi:hypothetical protein
MVYLLDGWVNNLGGIWPRLASCFNSQYQHTGSKQFYPLFGRDLYCGSSTKNILTDPGRKVACRLHR